MACLIASRAMYNERLAALQAQDETTNTFPSTDDLTARFRFKGRGGDRVPDRIGRFSCIVQTRSQVIYPWPG